MSEKDTVSSQDIPALIRALGTLALAAATAVAIKWFFSHEIKEEKTECNEEDLRDSLFSTVQEKTTYDGCIICDKVPWNTNPPEASDGRKKENSLLTQDCYDSDCYRSPAEISCISQSTNAEENGQRIKISCEVSSHAVNRITAVTSDFKEVATSPANNALSIQREDGGNASVPTSTTRGSATKAAKDQIFSGCLTHILSSIQEPGCSFGTSSNYGECIDDLNTRCSVCQHQNVQDKPFVQDNALSLGVSGDIVTNEPHEVLNCHSETNFIKHTTSSEEHKNNIDSLVFDFNEEDNTVVIGRETGGRKKVDVICNLFASETEVKLKTDACIPKCHNVPLISENTAKLAANSEFENDTLPCTEAHSHIQKASTACKNIVSSGDIFEDNQQNVTLRNRTYSQDANIYQSDGGQTHILESGIVTEIPNEDVKHCTLDAIPNIKCTTSPSEQKCNIDNLVIDFNGEDSTVVTSLEIGDVKCNSFTSETEIRTRTDACIYNYYSVPLICNDTTKCEVNSADEDDTLPCTEVFSQVQNTSSSCENIVTAGDLFENNKHNVTLHNQIDCQDTHIYLSDEGEKLSLEYGNVIPNEHVKDCILGAMQNRKCIASPVEQKNNKDNLVIDFNGEDNTMVTNTGIVGRKQIDVLDNTFTSETEMRIRTDPCVPKFLSVSLISSNDAKCRVNSTFGNDTLPYTEVFSHVQKASYVCENIVSADIISEDNKENITLCSRLDSHSTNRYQLCDGQNPILTNDIVTEIQNKEVKQCIQDALQDTNDDNKDTENMVPLLENVLPNKDIKNFQLFLPSMDADTGRYEVSESFQGSITPNQETVAANTHCYLNNTNELPLSEKWEATPLDDHPNHTALMDDLCESFNIDGKHSEYQSCAEEMSVVKKNISKDVSPNTLFNNSTENININSERYEFCAHSNTEQAVTMSDNIINDSTSFGLGSSTGVTRAKFISRVESVSYNTDNSEFQNWKTCRYGHHKGSNVSTNGYLNINHKVTEENNCPSDIIKNEDCCSKGLTSVLSEPSSSLQDIVLSTADFSLENSNSNVALPSMVKNSAQKLQQNANESYFFQDNVSMSRDEELSVVGDTFTSCSTPLAKGNQNDPMSGNFNITSIKDQNTVFTTDDTNLCSKNRTDVSHSREKIMSAIAENPELILPEYQSKCGSVKKRKLIAKSCDNILSRHSFQEANLKIKAQSMLCLLTEYYSSKLPSENGPVEEVARGSFIHIPKGLQSIGEAMRFQLTLGNCLELLKLARKNRVQDLLKAVYTVISDNYLNVLKNSAVYGQLTGLERERILQLRMRGTLSLCVVETKRIFGLNKYIRCPVETTENKAQLYALDPETNQWKPVTSIPEEACLKGCSICSMHNYLFIAGGLQETSDGLTCSNKLFCYNPRTDIWTQLSPMNEGRSQLKLIPLDGYLYAIGGECLHTVERYDPRANKWTFVAPLPKGTFAVAHESAACGGDIYISGGHLFYRLLKYSPVHDEWEECPFNTSKGRSCDMVAVGSILYRFDMHKDSSVNVLKYNTMAKMWSEYRATFPGSKIPFKCALLEGNIYCLNRDTIAKFSMNDEKVVFETGIFSNVPTKGTGSPHPIVLCLRGSVSQTSV